MKSLSGIRRIFLIRHGATEANKNGICQGVRFDSPLNKIGEAQSLLLGRFLRAYYAVSGTDLPQHIFSSPLLRARQTAEIVIREIFVACPPFVSIVEEFQEADHGEWDGKGLDQIKIEYPREFSLWCGDTIKLVYPGGEAVREKQKKVIRKLKSILVRYPDGDIMIFAHGGVNHFILGNVLGTRRLTRFSQFNSALNIIEHRPDEKNLFRITLLNSTAHLLELPHQ